MARIGKKQVTKTVPIPNDEDGGKITFHEIGQAALEDVSVIGMDLGLTEKGGLSRRFREGGTREQNVAWMVAAFHSWENIYDNEGEQAPCDKEHIAALHSCYDIWEEEDEMEDGKPTGEKTWNKYSLFSWANKEYDIFQKELKKNKKVAEKN